MKWQGVVWLATAWLMGCAHQGGPDVLDLPNDPVATAGVEDARLADLLDRHWTWSLAAHPEQATWYGIAGYGDRVTDPSAPAEQARLAAQRRLLAEAQALDSAGLSPSDALVWQRLVRVLRDGIAESACHTLTWTLSIRDNPVADLLGLMEIQDLSTPGARDVAARRIEAAAQALDVRISRLREGIASGRTANARSLAVVQAQVASLLGQGSGAWPPAVRAAELGDDGVIEAALEKHLRPAMTRFGAFLDTELTPAARPDSAPGLASLPDGDACYAARVARFTTDPDLTADRLHQTGLAELERIHAEMQVIGRKAIKVGKLPKLLDRLRSDPALRYDSAESILRTAEDALARAEAAVPAVFGRLPKTPCEVAPVPDHEAPYTTIAYYRPPSADGSRPGTYVVNTYEPTTRPRFEAEALAFHEAVPGHHLQIALQQELQARPALVRFSGATVHVEGWALYAEGLAEELGLYSSDLDRLGRLSFDAWRASRLVVDTGLHHLGWSREQAIDFLRDNTALSEDNVVNEVDRYIAWPGQALAYKTGELAIRALRAEAEEALGPRFDLAGFHDVVLAEGAVALPVLRERVRGWVASLRTETDGDATTVDGSAPTR